MMLSSFSFADTSLQCASVIDHVTATGSIKWYRNSAERNALYNQAYNMGAAYVENWVSEHHPQASTWGVIIDIDETALDNSWYYHKCGGEPSNESDFSHYVANQKKSVALPGVRAFVNKVHNLGGYVTMVSNRDGSFKDETGNVLDSTLSNLKEQHIYFDQVVLANLSEAKVPKDKNPRFNAVINGNYDSHAMVWSNKLPPHKVIAFFGDNIQDFPILKQSKMIKLDANDSTYGMFGKGYFIMPNPIYGSWTNNANN